MQRVASAKQRIADGFPPYMNLPRQGDSPNSLSERKANWHSEREAESAEAERGLADAKTDLAKREAATDVHATTSAQFENRGVDVVVRWAWAASGTAWKANYGEHICIELKPSFGDDYPTILRQMQRLEVSILVAGSYCGTTVSEIQIREMFRANGYKPIFVHEIEQEAARQMRLPPPEGAAA
jgi:hypothetical protein